MSLAVVLAQVGTALPSSQTGTITTGFIVSSALLSLGYVVRKFANGEVMSWPVKEQIRERDRIIEDQKAVVHKYAEDVEAYKAVILRSEEQHQALLQAVLQDKAETREQINANNRLLGEWTSMVRESKR